MAKHNNNIGIVYVLSNPAMPGIVKIGKTTRATIDERMRELYGTGVPVPFECEFACKVKMSDCAKLEKALHTAFEPNRINKNREFFKIQAGQAIALLEIFNQGDMTEEVKAEMENDLTSDDKEASQKAKRSPRPPLNFTAMGIPQYGMLTYTKDENIQAEVMGEKKVRFQGEELSLTALTQKLMNIGKSPIQPTPYWMYEGKNLRDIYDETYPLDTE